VSSTSREYNTNGEKGRGNPDTQRAAERYLRSGLAVIPIPAGEKNPNRRGWQHERLTIEDIPRCWSNGQNIGVLTGKPSGWLVDVDLDCPEAAKIAGRFLDPTLTSGRESTPDAHWWYRCEGISSKSFEEMGGPDAETILEIRANGHQTLVAPSLHPEGEHYIWSQSGLEFARVEAESLLRAVRELATATLVARVLPKGGRHRFGLALAGFLLRRSLEVETVEQIMHAAWDAAGFASEKARREAHADIGAIVRDTTEGLEEGSEVSGGRVLGELVEGLPRKLTRFWGWSTRDSEAGPSFAGRPGNTGTNGLASLRRRLTDLGNAERFVDDHGERVRYCAPWRKWLVYDGKRWRRDDTGEVERLMKATVRGIYAEAADEPNDDRRRELVKHAKNSEAKKRISDAIQLARSEPGVPILPEDLDADPWVLNVENGTVDLRSSELREHRREDLLSKLAPVEYRPEDEAPIFQAFLERILPQEAVRGFLQRAVGYASTGVIREEVLPILHGPGANGKTTLTGVLMEALGDYAIQAAPDLLMLKKGTHPTELADLYGARFVVCMETEEGRRLAESLVKYITGRERIKARRMREDFWEFAPTHTVFMGTNHRPDVRGTDHAIWRRLKLIPFDITIPEAEQDKTLPETLRSELPGILAWIVRGCIEYLRNGLGEPEQVMDATKVYRTDMDPLEAFIDEECVVRPESWCKFASLYSAYTRWCEESNEYPIKKRRFADRLTERGYERDVGTDGVKIRRGIALRHDGDPDPSRITDPAPDTDPDPHGSAPDLGENGDPGDDELPIGNSQKTCKSGVVDDRMTDHYRESYISTSSLPYKGLYKKVGNDRSFGIFEGDSPVQTSGSDLTEGLTDGQAQHVIELVRQGMAERFAIGEVLTKQEVE